MDGEASMRPCSYSTACHIDKRLPAYVLYGRIKRAGESVHANSSRSVAVAFNYTILFSIYSIIRQLLGPGKERDMIADD